MSKTISPTLLPSSAKLAEEIKTDFCLVTVNERSICTCIFRKTLSIILGLLWNWSVQCIACFIFCFHVLDSRNGINTKPMKMLNLKGQTKLTWNCLFLYHSAIHLMGLFLPTSPKAIAGLDVCLSVRPKILSSQLLWNYWSIYHET